MPKDNRDMAVAIKEIRFLIARVQIATTKIKRLRLLLDDVADYGQHKPGCRGPLDAKESGRCTCGFWTMQDAVSAEVAKEG